GARALECPPVRSDRSARDRGRRSRLRAVRAGARRRAGTEAAGEAGGHVGRVQRRHRRTSMTLAYVGLGSNLGDREATIRQAAALIGAARLSPLFETEPWGFHDQPSFLNAAAEVETPLGARDFLTHLLDVERRLGRERIGPRWGPRTIDLDLLLFGDE